MTPRHLKQPVIIPLRMPDLSSRLRGSQRRTVALRRWQTCSHGVIRRPLLQVDLAGAVIAAMQIMRIPIAVRLVAVANLRPAAVAAGVMRPLPMQTAAHRVTSSPNGPCWPRVCSMR